MKICMKQVNRKRKLKAVDGTKSMSKKAEPALKKTLTYSLFFILISRFVELDHETLKFA